MNRETSWTLIHDAAAGGVDARAEFARRYLPIVRRYLRSRWSEVLGAEELEDAVQEVFVECFRDDGVLAHSRDEIREGFRQFLFGVVRNVALRFEERMARRRDKPAWSVLLDRPPSDEERLSRVFDRAWARALVGDALQLLSTRAAEQGEEAERRAELLRLRFRDDLPIRAIAERWGVEPSHLHHEYARARREFERSLRDAVAEHHPGSPEAVHRECEALLDLLRG